MITKEKAQRLADPYNLEVVDTKTLHDCKKIGFIADYIKLKIKDKNTEHNIYVYFTDDYNIVKDKEFYVECKVKNALYNGI